MFGWGVLIFDFEYIFNFLMYIMIDKFGFWNVIGFFNVDIDVKIESLVFEID